MKDCGSCVSFQRILNWRLSGENVKKWYRRVHNGGICNYYDCRTRTSAGKDCAFHKRDKYKRVKKHNQKDYIDG